MSYPIPEFDPDPIYTFAMPQSPRPIIIIGAGGIVRDAHLPAYAKYGFPVSGIVNRTLSRAQALAGQYRIPNVYDSIKAAVAGASPDTVYDLALMPEQYLHTLDALPDGAAVLIQKPLGQDLSAAQSIVDLCHRKGIIAAVNTQLRFAPYIEQARRLIADRVIGELVDIEIHVTVRQPWELFPNVLNLDRLELNMHSVHYLDLVRSFLGNPTQVMCMTLPHPQRPYANCRTTLLLRYGDRPIRVVIATNHEHDYGPKYEDSYIKFEGTGGAIRAQMGLLLDYPHGGPDMLEIVIHSETDQGWHPVAFEGSWFPDAFAGSMSALQRFVAGEKPALPTSIDDVLDTMALVDAGHRSSDQGGITPNYRPPEDL